MLVEDVADCTEGSFRQLSELPQLSQPMAKWALQNKVGDVHTLVADYAPGLDAQADHEQHDQH